jgi:hypothetical protein
MFRRVNTPAELRERTALVPSPHTGCVGKPATGRSGKNHFGVFLKKNFGNKKTRIFLKTIHKIFLQQTNFQKKFLFPKKNSKQHSECPGGSKGRLRRRGPARTPTTTTCERAHSHRCLLPGRPPAVAAPGGIPTTQLPKPSILRACVREEDTVGREAGAHSTTPTYAFWLQKPSILRACVREEDAVGREAGAHS